MVLFPGKAYDEIEVGDSFGSAMTVTETHLVLAAGLFGDFNPLHTNEEHGKRSRFGSRILHGPFTSALVSASVGMYFGGTAIAYLEHTLPLQGAGARGRHAHHHLDHRGEARQAQAPRRHRGIERRMQKSRGRGSGRSRRKNSGHEPRGAAAPSLTPLTPL